MNLPFKFARRYLFAKRSTNAINIISGISVFGIAVGTAALVLILSVFNGFEDLIVGMYNNLDPDVKVTPVKGKTFPADSARIARLQELPGVEHISRVLEEVAGFEYKDNQDFGVIKGVDENYIQVTNLDSTIREGKYSLTDGQHHLAVVGLGMRNKLGINVDDLFSSISIYMPKRGKVGPFEKQFVTQYLYPAGTFIVQQDFDREYILASLDFVQRLLSLENEISALEIKLYPGFAEPQTYRAIQSIMGPDFEVKNRYEQEEAFFKLMQIEKWLSFAIVGLMLILVAFNMIGALWMIVLEKKRDIAILKAMGAQDGTVRNIFLQEGLLLSLLGIFMGSLLALAIYWLQKSVGIVNLPGNMSIAAYPVSIRWFDFVIVGITVSAIGLLASLAPAIRAMRISALIREE